MRLTQRIGSSCFAQLESWFPNLRACFPGTKEPYYNKQSQDVLYEQAGISRDSLLRLADLSYAIWKRFPRRCCSRHQIFDGFPGS